VFLLLTLIWGTTWAAIRIGLEGIPPFTGVALRFAIAAMLLLIVGRMMRVRFGRERGEIALWIVNGLLAFCASYGIVYWAEQWVPSGLAAVLFATYPLIVAILAHFAIPGERLNPVSVAGILLGFAGVAVIFSEDFEKLGGEMVALASLVMLGSPLVAAIASVAIKKWGAGIHPFSLTAVPMLMTAVIMGALAAVFERGRPLIFDRTSVGALLYLAVFGSAVTFSLYYWLLSHISVTRVSLIAYTIPLVAVAVGAGFLNEPITARTLAGSLLVVLGVALAVRSRPKSYPRKVGDSAG
jgi:drug/metabolite transporter (DMT)-like permease